MHAASHFAGSAVEFGSAAGSRQLGHLGLTVLFKQSVRMIQSRLLSHDLGSCHVLPALTDLLAAPTFCC